MIESIRNLAIVAHVDHGKTTLVDAMFRSAGTFRENQRVQERAMDTEDQERERGITILAKNTAIDWRGTRINLVDTPGHADFGGQVERVLAMADAVLLLVDAYEGPMPQTRFVLRKAFQHGLKALVMINKVDRPDQRAAVVLDEIFDLFVELGAHDEQLDFPVVYGSGRDGWASRELALADGGDGLTPLFEMILETVPTPQRDKTAPLQLQVATVDHDDFIGRTGTGRVQRGTIRVGQRVVVCHAGRAPSPPVAIKQLFRFEGLRRTQVEEVRANDIAVVGGIDDLSVGDTLCPPETPEPLPSIALEEPTISMIFCVNNSPFAGQEGRFVTSRQIAARLELAALRDVALLVAPTDAADAFEVKGRGVMHLGVLVESMRREGYEFGVGKPHVILKQVAGRLCEPIELAAIEVPTESAGKVIEYLGRRRGEMAEMYPMGADGTHTRIEFKVPSRGLIGARTALMTLTRGEAILSHVFEAWEPDQGRIPRRTSGVLISDRSGDTVPYALFGLLDRGEFFVAPGTRVYEGMIVGEHSKDKDLGVNVCREKKLTNVRSAGRDENVKLPPPRNMSLEECLEYIEDDELLEVTPGSLRLRKRVLAEVERRKVDRASAKAGG